MTPSVFAAAAAGKTAALGPKLNVLSPEQAPDLMASSPFVIGYRDLEKWFGNTPQRLSLLRLLVEHVDRLARNGVGVTSIMIGGSFVDTTAQPNDLDGLVLYTLAGDLRSDALQQMRRKSGQLDLRHVAADGDTVLLTKSIAFFADLYSRKRDGGRRPLLLLVDLEGAGN